ncbi:MAG: LysM peptidoglycan-binding domain-containing protein [Bacteroidota bacterium]
MTFSSSVIAQAPATHKVKSGETLFAIAKKYKCTVADLKRWNNLTSDNLQIGKVLKLQGGGVRTNADPNLNTSKNKNDKYHIVKSGETLSGISKKYGCTVTDIKMWNGLKTDCIQIGKKLIVAHYVQPVFDPNKQIYFVDTTFTRRDTIKKVNTDTFKFTQPSAKLLNKLDSLVAFAKEFIGLRYKWGGTTPAGFDCAGFVMYVFRHFNYNMPRVPGSQMVLGVDVPMSEARKGDVIFFKGSRTRVKKPGHVGIVVSEQGQPLEFIHSSSRGLRTDYFDKMKYYQVRYLCIRRVL